MAQIGVTNYCPPVFLRKFLKFLIIIKLNKDIKGMSKIYSHISSIVSSPLCGCPFYGMSFGYWYCDEIDFEESN